MRYKKSNGLFGSEGENKSRKYTPKQAAKIIVASMANSMDFYEWEDTEFNKEVMKEIEKLSIQIIGKFNFIPTPRTVGVKVKRK